MLARNPHPGGEDFDVFFRVLRIPERPAAIQEAEKALKAATAAREQGQARHIEAGKLLSEQRFGQATTITTADVDAIGAELASLVQIEEAAREARAKARQDYAGQVMTHLESPLEEYRQAIARHLTLLEDLLRVGCLLHSEAVSSGIRLPAKLPSFCPALVGQIHLMRQIMSRA